MNHEFIDMPKWQETGLDFCQKHGTASIIHKGKECPVCEEIATVQDETMEQLKRAEKAEARVKKLEDKEFDRVEKEGRDLDLRRLMI